ncbi:hypothetical protein LVB87_14125 [Lysobacter sp. KIS68-7]|uniref:hypothetical protein n=1 Tax=Lysobacter sp. KIS68-7 TaxID=2904252 RepID=UPI001E3914A9|nr:hypothetical protein [Lysobacter sp. KIS68-7]UHQ19304.1 hypothetical protein LVB87_14125 [Lysobacter sp. KIS68-7]
MYLPEDSVNEVEQQWFGRHLAAMREPVLSVAGKPKDYVAVRILRLPTFTHPSAVRVEAEGDRIVRRAVETDGQGGFDVGEVIVDRAGTLTRTQADVMLAELDATGFWSWPAEEEGGLIIMDGTEFVVEAIRNGEHRVRVRTSPDVGTEERGLVKFADFCESQFAATGFDDASELDEDD